jgi:hypothetical protein
MNWADLFPTVLAQLKVVQGVEAQLLRRRRNAQLITAVMVIGGAVLQVLAAVQPKAETLLGFVPQLVENLLAGNWGEAWVTIKNNALSAFTLLALCVGLVTYLTLRYTSFLLRESREPFRYTYEIAAFEPVKDFPRVMLLNLLPHDLATLLSKRIARLSPLDVTALKLPNEAQTSHIHVGGHYALREDKKSRLVLQVLPRVRIGPPGGRETAVEPVLFHLPSKPAPAPADGASAMPPLTPDDYRQLLERVYFQIASTIYHQIRNDVQQKFDLFPTRYLQAVARFHEARDFERSNTLDAYQVAIGLYQDSRRYFDRPTWWARVRKLGSSWWARFRALWSSRRADASRLPQRDRPRRRRLPPGLRGRLRSLLPFGRHRPAYLQIEAQVRIGSARCLTYAAILSALSGRSRIRGLFAIPEQIDRSVRNLLDLFNEVTTVKPIDLPDRDEWALDASAHQAHSEQAARAFLTSSRDLPPRRRRRFDERRRALYRACTVAAFAYAHLGAARTGENYLAFARAIGLDGYHRDPLWLLAAGQVQADSEMELFYLRRATEAADQFEIAQYLLARCQEYRLRQRDEIARDRVRLVIDDYDRVLRINPGNIAALAAQGYLWWLAEELEKAKEKFLEGCAVKAIVQETFVGELNYGLARIAAEKAKDPSAGQEPLNECYNLYAQALGADPALAAYRIPDDSPIITSYYEYIGRGILRRYQQFCKNVVRTIRAIRQVGGPRPGAGVSTTSRLTLDAVYSYAVNDYGNALLTYYFREGTRIHLGRAITWYTAATQANPGYAVPFYNLHRAYLEREENAKAQHCLDRAAMLYPAWQEALIAAASARIRQNQQQIHSNLDSQRDLETQLEQNQAERQRIQEGLAKSVLAPPARGSAGGPTGTVTASPARPASLKGIDAGTIGSTALSQTQALASGGPSPRPGAVVASSQGVLLGMPDQIEQGQELDRLGKVRQELERKLVQEKEKGKGLREELNKNVEAGVKQIAQDSKFSSLLCGYQPGQLSAKILTLVAEVVWERLDEKDVVFLRTLANILAKQAEPTALEAARVLVAHIVRYVYPEDFDANLILHEIATNKAGAAAQARSARPRARQHVSTDKLANQMETWLMQNSDAHLSRFWLRFLFPLKQRRRILKKLIARGSRRDVYHFWLGDEYNHHGLDRGALKEYGRAQELNPFNPDYPDRCARLYERQGQWEPAIQEHKKALALRGDAAKDRRAIADCYARIAGAEEGQEVEQGLAALERAAQAWREAARFDPQRQSYADAVVRVEERARLARQFGETGVSRWRHFPPVVVEIAHDLIPLVVEADQKSLKKELMQHLVTMRQEVLEEYGIEVPWVLLRSGGPALAPGAYAIVLGGVPRESGRAAADRRLCPVDPSELPAGKLPEGIEAEGGVNPITGEPALWVAQPDWDKALAQGLELWQPLEPLVRHLRAVLEANLAEFIGHQETVTLLASEPQLVRHMRAEPRALSTLVVVLRTLLAERVPLGMSVPQIAERVEELRRGGAGVLEIVAAVRCLPAVRPLLPGNRPAYAYYQLGRRLETALGQALRGQGARRVLALEPRTHREALRAIRHALGVRRQVALLVEAGPLRPFVRALIAVDLPGVPVLSLQELEPDLHFQITGIIDLP